MRELRFAIAAGLIAAVLSWSDVEGQSPLAPPCPNGSYTVTVSGVTGPACVSLHNRTYTMSVIPLFPNNYRQTGQFGCPIGNISASLYVYNSGQTADLYFNSPPPAARCDARYHCASFSCASGGTFTIRGAYAGSWPGTLTVNP